VASLRKKALERAKRYSWDAVTDQYEQLLRRACDAGGPGPLPPELLDKGPRPQPVIPPSPS
jgi:hypothetical protein